MEQLKEDVKKQINANKQMLRENINQKAEICAENYVSVVMGLEDDTDGTKQAIKNQYIELFVEGIVKII